MLASAAAAGNIGALTTNALLPSALGWIGLGFAVGWSGRQLRIPATWFSPWAWWLLLGAALLCFRWPLIRLPHELYPDESQLLAGAITLRQDPVFWRSVDGGTAGPPDYYALLPAAVFQDGTAFVAARIIACGLLWGALVAAGETLVLLTRQAHLRLAALPALLFLAFTTSPEYVHYSTELVPALLLAVAVHALARRAIRPTPLNLWAAALALGTVPWTKLQAAPIVAMLGLFFVIREFSAGRRAQVPLVIAAACLPTLAVLLLAGLTGQTEHMIVPYVLQNLLYVQSGRLPAGMVAFQQWQQAVTNGYLAAWFAGAVVFAAISGWRLRGAPAGLRPLVLLASGLFAVAVICVLAPGRPYPHYLHFLVGPLTLLLGALLAAGWREGSRWGPGLFCGCLVVPALMLKLSARPDPYAYYNHELTAPGPAHRELTARVRMLTRPGETLGLWGWRSALYVETGLAQATCQAHTESLLIAGPSQSYYLRRYLEKFIANSPPVFVDAVGPGNFRFQDRALGHEVFPFLRQWIKDHYILVGEFDGCRLYVRRDRPQGPAAVR